MASTTYSHSFGMVNAGVNQVYQLSSGQPGQVAVVRNMDFTAPTGGLQSLAGFRVDFADLTGAQLGALWFMGPGNVRQNRSYHWRGRATIAGGLNIAVTTLDYGWSFNVSGYLLGTPT